MQPAALPPTVSMSPERLSLQESKSQNLGEAEFGLSVRTNESDSLANVERLPGVKVSRVHPRGPAELAGIQANDVILSINGMPVDEPDVLHRIELSAIPDEELNVSLRRATTVLETVLLPRAVRGPTLIRELYRIDPIATRASYVTEVLSGTTEDRTGAKIIEIQEKSPYHGTKISKGDVILAVDGVPVTGAQALINRVNREYSAGDTVTFTVFSGDVVFDVSLKLWHPPVYLQSVRLFPLFAYSRNQEANTTKFHIIDVFPIYAYRQTVHEVNHRILWFFKFNKKYQRK